jgi:hypothetical protein
MPSRKLFSKTCAKAHSGCKQCSKDARLPGFLGAHLVITDAHAVLPAGHGTLTLQHPSSSRTATKPQPTRSPGRVVLYGGGLKAGGNAWRQPQRLSTGRRASAPAPRCPCRPAATPQRRDGHLRIVAVPARAARRVSAPARADS